MSIDATSARPTLDRWEVDHLRLTLFPAKGYEPVQTDWWEEVTGTSPESRQTRPKQRIFVELGEFDGGRLVNGVSPERIDWRLAAIEKKEPPAPFDVLGAFPDILSRFVGMLEKWIKESAPTLQRVALGGKIVLPVESRLEGNTVLGAYLPALRIEDPENNTDILYRINRRRPSRVLDGWKINRLCTWTVAESVIAAIAAGPQPTKPLNVQQVGETAAACQIEFDVNTDPHYEGSIPRELLGSIVDELRTAAAELVEKGDVV